MDKQDFWSILLKNKDTIFVEWQEERPAVVTDDPEEDPDEYHILVSVQASVADCIKMQKWLTKIKRVSTFSNDLNLISDFVRDHKAKIITD